MTIYDFILVLHCNCVSVSNCFRDIIAYFPKNKIKRLHDLTHPIWGHGNNHSCLPNLKCLASLAPKILCRKILKWITGVWSESTPAGSRGRDPGGLGAKPQKPEITVENMTDEEIDENTQIMKCACIL